MKELPEMKTQHIRRINPTNVEDNCLNWFPPCCLMSCKKFLQITVRDYGKNLIASPRAKGF